MGWSNQKTTLFIEDYHNTPELWDNRSVFYKDRNIKCDKLKQLAINYNCSVTDLKKKVKKLRSAFHREHKRITKPKSGSSPKKEKWFGYNLLTFLLDVDIPRETFSTAETLRNNDQYATSPPPLPPAESDTIARTFRPRESV
ncbi:hypothetical protein J6590_001260 [Homalodisca vitripennis]|nr:hypothetical protein J6590_001260 [Homalodisca vitripennis]